MNDIKQQSEGKRALKWILPIFLGIVAIILLFIFIPTNQNRNTSTPATESAQSKKIEALVGSQMVVKDNLKSPSSAKFPTIVDNNVVITKMSTDKYSVTSYVDSENSFGAMIRSYYTCTVILSEDTYRVEDLNFSE